MGNKGRALNEITRAHGARLGNWIFVQSRRVPCLETRFSSGHPPSFVSELAYLALLEIFLHRRLIPRVKIHHSQLLILILRLRIPVLYHPLELYNFYNCYTWFIRYLGSFDNDELNLSRYLH